LTGGSAALPLPAETASANAALGRRGFRRRASGADVRELRQLPAVQRHPEKIVLPRENNVLMVFRESRAVFAINRAGDLAALFLHVVVNEDIAFFSEDRHRLVFRQIARERRSKLRFILRKFAQTAPVAVDDIQVRLLQSSLARALPAEIDAVVVLRPVDAVRFIPD
jgi:hypothetical protein